MTIKAKDNRYSTDAIRKRFARAVHEYRLANDMKQSEVATKWKVNPTYLSNVITGKKDITFSILMAALRFGNMNLHYIMGGRGEIFLDNN